MRWLEDLIRRILEAIVAWINRCIPRYEPSVWNDGGTIEGCNNCYNYSCNMRTDNFAQPGHGSGQIWQSLDCPNVTAAAIRDGLASIAADEHCGCSGCCHRIALVMAPGFDYHWYRLDRDGKWSHKPGGTPATNLDNSGNLITDPRTANRGPYTVFCGFFCVCKDRRITISGPYPC